MPVSPPKKNPTDQASEPSQAREAPKLLLSLAIIKGWEGRVRALVEDAGFGEHTYQVWNDTQRDNPLANNLGRDLEKG